MVYGPKQMTTHRFSHLLTSDFGHIHRIRPIVQVNCDSYFINSVESSTFKSHICCLNVDLIGCRLLHKRFFLGDFLDEFVSFIDYRSLEGERQRVY